MRLLLSLPTTPPTPPGTVCTPGKQGVPDSIVGQLLCGQYATHAPQHAYQWLSGHWPHLAALLALVVALRVAWAVARVVAWRCHARAARFLEIVPPVTATPAATLGLWRLLATVLPRPSRLTLRPARLVWEVATTPAGMRCGLWIPPGVNPTAVARIAQRAWPGARLTQAPPPALPPGYPAAGRVLRPARPEWLPLLDNPDRQPSRWRDGPEVAEDRMRAVFDGLAAAGRTGGGLLQVVVQRAPKHRVAVLRHATLHPTRARHGSGSLRTLGLATRALQALIRAVLDLVAPGPTQRSVAHARAVDPYAAELTRDARAKYATSPHLLVEIRAIAAGATRGAARAAAADITSGYALLSAHLRPHYLRRAHTAARSRWVPERRMWLATVPETAAVAGVPAEPSVFGLPAAAARHRPRGRDTWHTRHRPPQPHPGTGEPEDPDTPTSTSPWRPR
jgi:hypothetical protein